MGPILLILLIAVPIAELWFIVQVADFVGIGWTLVLLFSISIAGAWLLKQQGVTTWKRLRETISRGEIPTKEVTDGAMILFGGALLLTPGFLTDAVGLLLLFPPTRATVKTFFRRAFARRARRWGAKQGVYETRVVHVERTRRDERDNSGATPSSGGSRPLPSSEGRDGEGGSPGTR